ncbi:DNA-directed RNA polymerase subunit L [Candidatus Bathyarchaeota archaeon]|nr:DNA-directed RNA polymerase subunit L [Candidatus Bathyarchaeota archaeon]MBL7079164.1 DNA-directed RNA polymerase subunit L [Candidatus Bathyarchaeota archaeon]
MKLRKVREEDKQLEMEVGGEGHTLLNLLQSSLLKNSNVKMAGYSKPHPLMDRSVFYVTLRRGTDFDKALIKAANDAKKELADFLGKFEAEIAKNN